LVEGSEWEARQGERGPVDRKLKKITKKKREQEKEKSSQVW
jgi:hypothetical protein